ncbi:MAG: hypothetical protein V1743_04885 [Nanoarchaeota archaeon]
MASRIIPVKISGVRVESFVGSFDTGIAYLKEKGYSLWTARDLAHCRILAGPKDEISTDWSVIAENVNYFPRDPEFVFIADSRHNPLLQSPAEATSAHLRGEEFYLDEGMPYISLTLLAERNPEKAFKSGVLSLPRQLVEARIPVESFSSHPLTYFLFRDMAGQYGNFLKENKIADIGVGLTSQDHLRKQKQPFGRALRVSTLSNKSNISDHYNLSVDDGQVSGVQYIPAERDAPELLQEIKGLENMLTTLEKGVLIQTAEGQYRLRLTKVDKKA